MRKLLTAFCLVTASVATSWAEQPPAVIQGGELGFALGFRTYENTQDTDYGDIGIAGAIYGSYLFPIARNYSAQIEGRLELYDDDAEEDYKMNGAGVAGVHLSYREPSLFQIGGFAAMAGASTGSNGFQPGFMAGAEAQAYLNDFTFYMQIGYAKIVNDLDDGDRDSGFQGFFVGGELRYFINEDFMVYGNAAIGFSPDYYEDYDGGGGEASNFGLGAKIRIFDETPLYLQGSYNLGHYDANTEDDGEEHLVFVGVTWSFGAPTLKANDRNGASLSLPMLPARAAGWGEALD